MISNKDSQQNSSPFQGRNTPKNILVLVKTFGDYGSDYNNHTGHYSTKPRAGLFNSANMLVDALNDINNITATIDVSIDGNDIDRKIAKYNPDICIIEAIWVTPDKFRELTLLWPDVMFIVRVHSKVPFLAMEGVSFMWMKEYINIPNVSLSFNNGQTSHDMNELGYNNYYLPNIYTKFIAKYPNYERLRDLFHPNRSKPGFYNIGCFGAIRPFKNQLNQAMAAMTFAEQNKAIVNFYINAGRVEQAGDSALKNIRSLFKDTDHTLVEIGWLEREDFLDLLNTIDISMQVSFSESFNIVTADSVFQKVPVVISPEIYWLDNGVANPNVVTEIVGQLNDVWRFKNVYIKDNLVSLMNYNNTSIKIWKQFFNNLNI